MKLLLSGLLSLAALIASAQYGDAYHNAYQVDVWRQQSQKMREELNRSTQPNSRPSASNRTTISGDYNSYAWSEAGSRRMQKQEEAAARQNAAYYSFHCKSGNCKSGSGTWLLSSGDLFTGSFRDGYPDLTKTAKLSYSGGATAEGMFKLTDKDEYIPVNGKVTLGNGSQGTAFIDDKGWVRFKNAAGKQVAPDGSESANYSGSTTSYCQGSCIETLIPADNSYTYTGNTLNGIPHGKGELKFSEGMIYAGDFKDGLPNGKGSFKWKDGAFYEGEVSKGNMHGFGTLNFGEGSIYQGTFKQGALLNGFYRLEKGTGYEGAVKNGKFEGEGTYKFSDGKRVFRGIFRSDTAFYGTVDYGDGVRVFNGYMQGNTDKWQPYAGVYEASDHTYYGYLDMSGKRKGYGYYMYRDSAALEGKWTNGEVTTLGSYIYPNQTKITGKFNYKGAKIYGIYKTKDGNFPAKLTSEGIVYLPAAEQDEAIAAYKEAATFITNTKPAFEKLMSVTY